MLAQTLVLGYSMSEKNKKKKAEDTVRPAGWSQMSSFLYPGTSLQIASKLNNITDHNIKSRKNFQVLIIKYKNPILLSSLTTVFIDVVPSEMEFWAP